MTELHPLQLNFGILNTMVKKTIQIGNKVLRAKATSTKNVKSASVKKLVNDLVDSMRASNLVGIAAPQIGKSVRIFVTEIRKTKTRSNIELDGLRVFINPKIISVSKKKVRGWEGCGSVAEGGLFAVVPRPQSVEIEAYDAQGEKFILKSSGLLARIIQHENDHLNGIMFTDIADMNTLVSRDAYLKIKKKKIQSKKF